SQRRLRRYSGGQSDFHGRTALEPFRLRFDRTAEVSHQRRHDIETQSRPATSVDIVAGDAIETPEDAFEIRLLEADAAIANGNFNRPILRRSNVDFDFGRTGRIFDGVIEQVLEHGL